MKLTLEINSVAELYELGDILKKLPALQTESTSIYLLDLDIRSYKCLKAERIDTIEQLVKCSAKDLLNTPNLGRKSIDLIRSVLAKRGLKLLGD